MTADQALLDAVLPWLRQRLRAAAGQLDVDAPVVRDPLADLEPAADPPAALRLAARLGLTRFELSLLLLCYLAELDPELAAQCAALQGQGHGVSFAVALAALPDAAWDALLPGGPLRRLRLVDVPAGNLLHGPLRLDERIANELRGLGHLDERLAAHLQPLPPPRLELPASHARVLDAALALLRADDPPNLGLVGPDPGGARLFLAHLAARLGRAAFRLPLELAPTAPAELDTFVRLWTREALLAPSLLLVDTRLAAADLALERLVHLLPGPLVIDGRDLPAPLAGALVPLDLPKPTAREQQRAWQALAGLDDPAAARLAAHFDLGLPDIARAAALARATEPAPSDLPDRPPAEPAPSDLPDRPPAEPAPADLSARPARLWDACLALTRPRLDTLATRIRPRAGWDDLVLPPDALDLLHQLADQFHLRAIVHDAWGFGARVRGAGTTALFTGESGTGKTLAAEVVAGELGLDLYRIDLSQVVSKYIGETEKNLRRLFDAAEDGAAVLFFDEADALFGKRSEVRDSHDRFANIETGYLLQRLEGYRGLAILATNLRDNLDNAFLRRLRFVVHFPFPGPAERARIWRRSFPAACDTARLDFAALAELNLTGGHIANVAVNAAFLAARAGGPLTMAAVQAAARAELRKLSHL